MSKILLVFFYGFTLCLLQANEVKLIQVDSPAFVFSPGNWVGDEGRVGKEYRQTWNTGAYFHFEWESEKVDSKIVLKFDTSMFPNKFRKPLISYCLDGYYRINVSVHDEVIIDSIKRSGKHKLSVYFQSSVQKERWGSKGKSGLNVVRFKGIEIAHSSKINPKEPEPKWAMIIGDSITEGIGTTALSSYSHLIGQALSEKGYGYCISACGWSGWLNRGDNPPGDVPGYYVMKDGTYHDELSRWNKIDGNNHSLLDTKGQMSAYGKNDQQPSLIIINYGTNDILHKSNPVDTKASMEGCLEALRKSAPDAEIVLIVPFGQYYAKDLHEAASKYDEKVSIIDLKRSAARSLSGKDQVFGGLHPNDRGHANFAVKILSKLFEIVK